MRSERSGREESSNSQIDVGTWPYGYEVILRRRSTPDDGVLKRYLIDRGLLDRTVGERGLPLESASEQAEEVRRQIESGGGDFQVFVERHLPDYLLH